MQLDQLLTAVNLKSVVRLTVKLATANADGLVCPPTYAAFSKGDGPYIAFRTAFIENQPREVVVLDSPQSQSNRIESAILQALRAKRISYPDIEIRFPSLPEEPIYSVLQLSHRIYDAVMRATTTTEGEPFFNSAIGRAILASRPSNATALFEHAPITLALGAWDSNGGSGPLAAKIPRLLTSEILGLDAQLAAISATKFDPMDIRSNVAELVATTDASRRFEIKSSSASKPAKGAEKAKRPSEFGFGSVPATAAPRAAVISGAIQTSVLSCAGLRQLSFPTAEGEVTAERDAAGRAAIASFALYGLVAQNEAGYRLRSRCELIPSEEGRIEIIGRTLNEVEAVSLGIDEAAQLVSDALAHAKGFGLNMRETVISLNADDRLTELVKRSRSAVAAGEADSE